MLICHNFVFSSMWVETYKVRFRYLVNVFWVLDQLEYQTLSLILLITRINLYIVWTSNFPFRSPNRSSSGQFWWKKVKFVHTRIWCVVRQTFREKPYICLKSVIQSYRELLNSTSYICHPYRTKIREYHESTNNSGIKTYNNWNLTGREKLRFNRRR